MGGPYYPEVEGGRLARLGDWSRLYQYRGEHEVAFFPFFG